MNPLVPLAAVASALLLAGGASHPAAGQMHPLVPALRTPQVVGGEILPLVAGAPAWPEGIQLATAESWAAAYRADDVRWLGVREAGRAGAGPGVARVVSGGGDPNATFERPGMGSEPAWVGIDARLAGARADADGVRLACDLVAPVGARQVPAGRVHEAWTSWATPLGRAYLRTLRANCWVEVEGCAFGYPLRVLCLDLRDLEVVARAGAWTVVRAADGTHLAVSARPRLWFTRPDTKGLVVVQDGLRVLIEPEAGRPLDCELAVAYLPLPAWDERARFTLTWLEVP